MLEKDELTRCSICEVQPVSGDFPRAVCRRCDTLALDDAARPVRVDPDGGGGGNPVFIDARQCWRRYEHGGWVTMLDVDNCRDYYEFCKRNDLPTGD